VHEEKAGKVDEETLDEDLVSMTLFEEFENEFFIESS
jgi:hypothetical protein